MASDRIAGLSEVNMILEEIKSELGFDNYELQEDIDTKNYKLTVSKEGRWFPPVKIPNEQIDDCSYSEESRVGIRAYLRRKIWEQLHWSK
jgi:hypothetical protein